MPWKSGSLSGTQDGTNRAFTLPFNLDAATLAIRNNGIEQEKVTSGAGMGQYVLSDITVTFGYAPKSADRLRFQGREI